jgi:rhomboid protease GluP
VQDERCLNCGRWNPGLWGFAPALTRLGRDMGFVPFVITSCVVVYVLSILVAPSTSGGLFGLLSPTSLGLFAFGASGNVPVLQAGRWWTFLSASFLHANLIHIAVNMMSLRNVAPIVAEFYGASRMIVIYVVSGVIGFALSTFAGTLFAGIPFLGGGGMTVGASASIAGLIGAVFFYGHRTGSSGIAEQARLWILMFIGMGFLFQGIDNWAHLGGLAGGYLSSKYLDPMYPERLDHFIIALVLLALSGLAIIVSVITTYQMFG